jgi:uncharacterized protein
MLEVYIRELDRGAVETDALVPPGDTALGGLEVRLAEPLRITGRLQSAAEGEYFWRGRMIGTLVTECRRCLAEVRVPVDAELNVLFSSDPDMADDPSVYPLPARPREIDLRPVVREELALAAPGFPLCREACAGLCAGCGADLNAGPCACASPADST